MKKIVNVSVLSLFAFGFFLGCEKKVDLNTDLKKGSYAVGQQIGTNFKNQNIEIDPEVFAVSIKEAIEGKPSRLKPEEIQQAMMKLQESVSKKQQETAEKNMKESKEFLEKNKSAADVKTTASGLQYTMVTEGTGKTPTLQDSVKAHYKGTLINGQTFDSSYDRGQPAEFPVSGVIKGWTEALQMMKVGGKIKLVIPPELAYGPSARPGIPPNSVLLFEIELLDVKEGGMKPEMALNPKAAAAAGKADSKVEHKAEPKAEQKKDAKK